MTIDGLIAAALLGVLGGGCLVLTLLTLPGNWLLLLVAAVAQWWSTRVGGAGLFSWWTLGGAFVLCIVGEVLETAMSAAGASAGGARGRGAWGAIAGSLVGALVGTVLLAFIPLAGTLLGALAGAAIGAFVGELTYGDRPATALVKPAAGAAAGRMAGLAVKLGVGALLWTLLVGAALWP